MKTLSAMEVRKHFGAVMDEVRLKSETIILERAGKPVAMIEPFRAEQTRNASETMKGRLDALNHLAGLGQDNPRSQNLDAWLENERDGWGERL